MAYSKARSGHRLSSGGQNLMPADILKGKWKINAEVNQIWEGDWHHRDLQIVQVTSS